ncbi:bifunctional GNAT family N-acetyltransferase/acetate--CoA ligase family protein [Amycolatopsis keratiniphila]|uniref:bifunctional acetate--CoA ligase family protein/GNAT family N-acetyltransferase n=1 Tax=Amycolatopsis keratiniphila TaxID=129921 RepID=UPI0008795886|nr:bifunctional GNAT family N-acetyltransferase/acetate--CoA ligase family protein [Amycolatopsis keratiniphila]OLZ48623.1 GNAT family N-acetyltransferase [Amycolatopsis keratiniphila subsp. nogabecina]SDU36067.1 Acyl-CoA synthetase (NDP forming) [Amycolatopsis keratiniphila]
MASEDTKRDPYDYPREWEADVLLSDGGTVHLRPVIPSDADGLVAFHGRLSERTRYFRYFGAYPRIPQRDLERFSVVDHHDRVAFVALLGDDIVAVGRYERLEQGPSAEVAFVVDDAHQGRGLGSILLEHLAAAASESGLRRFVAEVLAENAGMVRVFRDAGYQVSREIEEGVLHLEFDIDPTEESLAVARSREQAAEARSVHNLLHPKSVAVIGASTDPTKIGYVALTNLLSADFAGTVYPVNPEHKSVRGVRAYPSVVDIPEDVDLALVAVPAEAVESVLDGALAKGVKTLLIVSGGFAEAGPHGLHAELRLVGEARAHGMRVVGPNALGVLNTDASVRLNATLAPRLPARGRTGFFCQSGALGTAILADAEARGLGLSTFVSAGNRADVSGNDLLQYWETDPATDLVLLYLESFGNPRKFARLARRLARTKPVVAVKSGRHAVRPQLAATSAEVDESSVQALFEQAGVVRVDTLAQLFDTALVFAHQPLPAGPRIAIVGNSSAIGLLAADTARAHGLRLTADPVDVGPQASPEEFAAAVREALNSPETDALVVVFVPPLAIPGTAYARALREAVVEMDKNKPIVSTFLAVEGVPDELAVLSEDGVPTRGSVPSYPSPERAVNALARVVRYAAWRQRPQGNLVRPAGLHAEQAQVIVGELLAAEDGKTTLLSDDDVVRLLGCYGIDVVPFRVVTSADEAVKAAEELGFPVTLKAVDERLRGRPDLAGVRLDLSSVDGVRRAYLDLREISGDDDVYVQRMAPKGLSCVIGLQDDPSFGTLVSFGLSGLVSTLLGDRAYRAVPLTDVDAATLLREPRTSPLLTGYRGDEPADLAALQDIVLRVAALAEDNPEVRSMTLDPILASPDGAFVANARIVLGPPPSRPDTGPRRLRPINAPA